MLHKSIITGIALSVLASSYPLYCGISGLDQDQCPSLELVIPRQSISMPLALRNIEITHKDNRFYVDDAPVANHRLDKGLRNIPTDKLSKMLTANAYLQVNKSQNNEEYAVALQHRLQGGGAIGAVAGIVVGKGLVYGLGYGLMWTINAGVTIVCPPAAPGIVAVTSALLAPAIEAAAIHAGVVGGITGAVITGPV